MAGGQSDPPPPFGGSDASSSPLSLNSVGTAPACDNRQLHADLDQASNLPLPPSPNTPPLDESDSAPTNAPDSIPKIVVDLATPISAPSNPAPAAAATASSPSMAPVSHHPSSLTTCLHALHLELRCVSGLAPGFDIHTLTPYRHSPRQMAPKMTQVRPAPRKASPRPRPRPWVVGWLVGWLLTAQAGKIYSISGLVPTTLDCCATP